MHKRTLTTFEIAKFLYIDSKTVARWIDSGKLKAYYTPGGHRRVTRENLIQFIKDQNMPLPEELVGKKGFSAVVITENEEDYLIKEKTIKEKGGSINICINLFEAGKTASNSNPDLLVIDIRDNKVNGEITLKLLRDTGSKLKTAVITGDTDNLSDYISDNTDIILRNTDELVKLIEEELDN